MRLPAGSRGSPRPPSGTIAMKAGIIIRVTAIQYGVGVGVDVIAKAAPARDVT
jgi:hypothetical protein